MRDKSIYNWSNYILFLKNGGGGTIVDASNENLIIFPQKNWHFYKKIYPW